MWPKLWPNFGRNFGQTLAKLLATLGPNLIFFLPKLWPTRWPKLWSLLYDLFAVHEGRPRAVFLAPNLQNVVGPIMALPRSHRSAFQSAKNKENRDLVSQNPQNFLACGAASRSPGWRSEISYFAQMLRFMVNPL